MTTPTPTWGENSGANPTPPQQPPAGHVATPSWGSSAADPASPSSGLGLQPQAGELSFVPAGYEPPGHAPTAPRSVTPTPVPSPAPAPLGGYPTNDPYAGAGYPDPASPVAQAPYPGYPQQDPYYGNSGPVPYVGVPGQVPPQAPSASYAQTSPYQEPYGLYQDPYAQQDPYYQAPAYGLSPYPMMTTVAPPPTGLAIASMVIGIVSFFIGLCGWFIPLPITGLVLGIVALQKANNGQAGGKGMAIAGVVLSGLATVASIGSIVWFFSTATYR